jgi:hypothetical protein
VTGQAEGDLRSSASHLYQAVPLVALSGLVSLLVLLVVACGGSRSQAGGQPAWVTSVVATIEQRIFVKRPRTLTVFVTHRRRGTTETVTVTFPHDETCRECTTHGPSNAPVPRGRRALLTLDARTHDEIGFRLTN